MFYFVVRSRTCHMFTRLYIFECKFNNTEYVITVYFENSTFSIIVSWSGLVGSSQRKLHVDSI